MKRLCFLSPDVEHARSAIGALRSAGIADRHLYVVARHDINLEGLPDAGPEDDDFLPAYERGLAIGGVGGLLAGLLAMAFPITGFAVGGTALLLVTLYGAGFSGLLTALARSAFPSSRLEKFQVAIGNGKLLILADVTDDDIAACEAAVRRVDPQIDIEGIEPPVPVVP
ncbi:MAG: DUF1269 domain-containing protein [Porticoccaceae bacterium]